MIYFTNYANNKFEILNKHQVYFRKEQIEEVLSAPEKIGKKGNYLSAKKDGLKVVYKKEGELIKVITFYPVK